MTAGLAFYLVAVPAVILLGLSKGGFAGIGLLSLPLLALVLSPIRAAGIMLPLLIVQDVVTVYAYRRSWDGRNLAILLPGSLAGVALGYILAARVSDAAIALLVGSLTVLFATRRLALEFRRGAAACAGVPTSIRTFPTSNSRKRHRTFPTLPGAQ